MKPCIILGAPVSCGAGRSGCERSPEALREAGLADALRSLGRQVIDIGDLRRRFTPPVVHANSAIKHLAEVASWIEAISDAVHLSSRMGLTVLLGGDHSVAAGSLAGLARSAQESEGELFVLWLDAHPDFHTLDSTCSGNLHGVPLAYASGQHGFDGYFPQLAAPVKPENICLMGIRSVDPAEQQLLRAARVNVHDMEAVRKYGVEPLLEPFLSRVVRAGGNLHVSLDADFLDPQIAPGVGTRVLAGADIETAREIMEMVRRSGALRSAELVELNPLLDIAGKTAKLMVALVGEMIGFAARAGDSPTPQAPFLAHQS
jgi:arginase